MPGTEEQKSVGAMMKTGLHRFGVAPLFVLINGLVIGAVTFVILAHQTADQKEMEARSKTREIIHSMEQSVAEAQRTTRALAAAFSVARTSAEFSEATQREIIGGDFVPSGLLWVMRDGTYHQENIAPREVRKKYDPDAGWPSYQDMYRDAYNLLHNEIAYWGVLGWPAFKGKDMAALVEKVRTDMGETGILMIAAPPSEIFGKSWLIQRDDILRTTIIGNELRDIVADIESPSLSAAADGFFKPEEVGYTLQIDDRAWDVRFLVQLSATTHFVVALPWIAFGIIFCLTVVAVILAERKRRQDQRMEEMSRTLAGAHHELQTKTSERDKLFHALRKSEREYRAVINSVSDVIFETDETGRLVFLNETWKRVTNAETEDYVGTSLFDVISASDRVRQREMFDGLVRGERQAYRIETHLELAEEDRPRAVEVAFSMLRMTDDKSLRVVGTITDIEKRRRAEAAMREAEQRYRAIFENSVSGIYQIAADGRFISTNPALAEILGYETTEEMMFSVMDVADLYVRRSDREAFVQKLLFDGRVVAVESEVYRKDGSKIWVMENARVVRSRKGKIMYYEGSVFDVTERRQAEEAMRQARLQAEISSRSRMEFLANMSHELRTPLNAVIGFSEIIKGEVMGPIGTPAYKEYAQDIYESGNYLLKIISEILEVSKIETGNRELNQTNFRVVKAVKSCMTIMASRIEQSGVEVKVDLSEDLPEILAEELGFKQVLLNLIGNAIKFSNHGGKVTVSAQVADSGEMSIDITDTGIGMSPEEIEKALQPFGKVDNNFSTMKEGTGLGLTIVDSLIRLHGGRLELMSEKGKGTTARIVLPAYRVLRLSNVTSITSAKK